MKNPTYLKKPKPKPKRKGPQGIARDELNKSIIDIYKQGGSTEDVEKYLKSIGREKTIRSDIYNANLIVKDNAKLERDSLIQVHVKRYERLFQNNYNKKVSDFPCLEPHIAKYLVVDSLMIALDALVAKEKVLGLHTKNFRVQLNNFFKKKILAQYNFASIDFNLLVRLKELLAKMKQEEAPAIEYFNDLEDETKEAKTIDVDHIVVNDRVSALIKEEVKLPIVKNGKLALESIKDKILAEDLKKNDPKRKSFMVKLLKK